MKQTIRPLDRSLWAGCDYCNDPQPYRDCVLPDGTEQILCCEEGKIPFDNPFGNSFINERKIEYCPYCGKPITERAWKELERRINGEASD